MNRIQIEAFQQFARDAKTPEALEKVIEGAFTQGVKQGRRDRQAEVRNALTSIGVTEDDFFEQST